MILMKFINEFISLLDKFVEIIQIFYNHENNVTKSLVWPSVSFPIPRSEKMVLYFLALNKIKQI